MIVKEVKEKNINGYKRFVVSMGYDKNFIEVMKKSIAFPHRIWDPDEKKWHFSEIGIKQFRLLPGVIFYEEALNEMVDLSGFNLPESKKEEKLFFDWKKFNRPAKTRIIRDPSLSDSQVEVEIAPPLSLWTFQKLAISRIWDNHHQGLWMEPGLGKTYTAVCAAMELLEKGLIDRCLVISCVSIALDSWITTFERMGVEYDLIDGPMKYRPTKLYLSSKPFVLALHTSCSDESYKLFETEESMLLDSKNKGAKAKRGKKSFVDVACMKKTMMVVDEIHKLSNTQSKTFKAMRKMGLASEYRVPLTGTVMKAVPEKCLLPLRFLHPEIFSNKAEFEEAFTVQENTRYGLQIVGYRNIDFLKKIIHNVGQVALKKDHLKELPALLPAVEIVCETDQLSLDLINKMRNEDEAFKIAKSYLELKDLYIRIHQALVCPSVFGPKLKATNRLQAVSDLVESINGKVVIYTTLKAAITELYAHLKDEKIRAVCCTGDNSFEEIQEAINLFSEDPNLNVLIATIQKMGTGFDRLKVASTAIIYDHNSNASDIRQAIDRLHRAGQKNEVSVYHITQDNPVSVYQYEKYLFQKKLMEDIESGKEQLIESSVDIRHVLDLVKASNTFGRIDRRKK